MRSSAFSSSSSSSSLSSLVRLTATYLLLVNAGSASIFAYDKYQAVHGGWRVPERQLVLSGLAGGWPAGYLAMSTLRHKTVKRSFRDKYDIAALSSAGGMLGLAAMHPHARHLLLERARAAAGPAGPAGAQRQRRGPRRQRRR